MIRRILLLVPALVLLAACGKPPVRVVAGGNAERGRELVLRYDCVDCHVVPGVDEKPGAIQKIPLEQFAWRSKISRETIENTPENLVAYLQHPRGSNPQSVMPGIGAKEADAKDLAAFLYTLD